MLLYQEGETVYGENAVSDLLFNSRANYTQAFDKKHVMQGSCNVTGIGRILQPLRENKVPTRQMHLHIMDIRFKDSAPKQSEVLQIFKNENGVAILWTAKGTKEVRDYANTMNFSFKDTNMIHIHANMTESIGDTVKIMYSDDQTGIVIPENHMLMQAMLFHREYDEAFKHTEDLFHIKEKKKALEDHFARKN